MGNVLVKNPTIIGGSSADLGTKMINENGTYDASTDGYDGYSSVNVNVSSDAVITEIDNVQYTGTTSNPYQTLTKITSNINYLEIHDGCENINCDFTECSNLTTIILPTSLQSIRLNISNYYSPELTAIYYKGTIQQWIAMDFESWTFPEYAKFYTYNDSLATYELVTNLILNGTHYELESDEIYISGNAFAGYNFLQTVELGLDKDPLSSVHIGSFAFQNCDNLTSVNINVSTSSDSSHGIHLGSYAFARCDSLDTILLVARSIYLANQVFEECRNLRQVNLYADDEGTMDAGSAFYNCKKLTSIDLSQLIGLTEISWSMFNGCSNLVKVILPSSLQSIKNNAFYGCKLKTITIPENVTEIGSDAFRNNYIYEVVNLSSLPIQAGSYDYGQIASYASKVVQSVSDQSVVYSYGCVYDSNDMILVGLYTEDNFSVGVSNNLTGCSNYCHSNIGSNVYRITIPFNCTGSYNFSASPQLREVINYSSSATVSLGYSAVEYSDISQSQLSIIDNCLCLGDTVIDLAPNANQFNMTITDSRIHSIDGFSSNYKKYLLKTLNLKNSSISTIAANSFYGQTTLQLVTLPSTLTQIGSGAFDSVHLRRLEYDGSIASWLGFTAGPDCYNYTGESNNSSACVAIGDQLLTPGYFFNNNLQHITIPNTLSSIREHALSGYQDVRTIDFESPAICTTIGAGAFSGCTNLYQIELPDTLQRIDGAAFADTNINNIYIPASVENVYYTSFNSCPLNTITVDPSNAHYKEEGNCLMSKNSIPYLVFGSSNPDFSQINYSFNMSEAAFWGRKNLSYVKIDNLESLPRWAFTYCDNLKEVDLSDSIITLAANPDVFDRCKSLKKVILPKTLTSFYSAGFGKPLQTLVFLNNDKVSLSTSQYSTPFAFLSSTNRLDIYVYPWLIDAYQNDSTWSQYSQYITFKALKEVEELIVDEDCLFVGESPVVYAHFTDDTLVKIPNQYLDFSPALNDGVFGGTGEYTISLPNTSIYIKPYVSDN